MEYSAKFCINTASARFCLVSVHFLDFGVVVMSRRGSGMEAGVLDLVYTVLVVDWCTSMLC